MARGSECHTHLLKSPTNKRDSDPPPNWRGRAGQPYQRRSWTCACHQRWTLSGRRMTGTQVCQRISESLANSYMDIEERRRFEAFLGDVVRIFDEVAKSKRVKEVAGQFIKRTQPTNRASEEKKAMARGGEAIRDLSLNRESTGTPFS